MNPKLMAALIQASETLNHARGIAACTASKNRDPDNYNAWLNSRAPEPPPPDTDAIALIDQLAYDLKNAVRAITHSLTTGEPKPDRQEDAACDAWLQTAADLYYICNVMTSEQPAHMQACAELIEDENTRGIMECIAFQTYERVSQIIRLLPDEPQPEGLH